MAFHFKVKTTNNGPTHKRIWLEKDASVGACCSGRSACQFQAFQLQMAKVSRTVRTRIATSGRHAARRKTQFIDYVW